MKFDHFTMDLSPLGVKSKAEIVLNVELQNSFWHSRIKFYKKFYTKKSQKINLNFISKSPFEISSLQSKVMNKIQRRFLKMSKKMSLPILLSILSMTFVWRLSRRL